MAKYLSERGFAVLTYDKRGVGPNITISDTNAWGNLTFDNLKQDAEKALSVPTEAARSQCNQKGNIDWT